MSNYHGPKVKLTQRLGELPGLTIKKSNRYLDNEKTSKKSDVTKKKKLTEYGLRLKEKQKLKFNYGLTESQLFRYVKEARRRQGVTGLILLQLLEMRLDTICFTLGFAKSIGQARQFVNHGHITVNNRVVNIPSFQCRLNDLISVKDKYSSKTLIETNIKTKGNITIRTEQNEISNIPNHLKLNSALLKATVVDYCDRNDVSVELDELLVIEFYSRR